MEMFEKVEEFSTRLMEEVFHGLGSFTVSIPDNYYWDGWGSIRYAEPKDSGLKCSKEFLNQFKFVVMRCRVTQYGEVTHLSYYFVPLQGKVKCLWRGDKGVRLNPRSAWLGLTHHAGGPTRATRGLDDYPLKLNIFDKGDNVEITFKCGRKINKFNFRLKEEKKHSRVKK